MPVMPIIERRAQKGLLMRPFLTAAHPEAAANSTADPLGKPPNQNRRRRRKKNSVGSTNNALYSQYKQQLPAATHGREGRPTAAAPLLR